ncbi:killer toxin, kp4 [Mycena amicta]|nr:killer toxin, kp4 [Mycena amicta]
MAAIAVAAYDNTSPSTIALGINCEGSFKCGGQATNTAETLVENIDSIGPNRMYSNGEHIACRDNVCAFLQDEEQSRSGEEIKSVAHEIVDHGCKVCGSVPTSSENNVAYGELTFNYVDRPACEGLC